MKIRNHRLVLESVKLVTALIRLAIKLIDLWNMTSNYARIRLCLQNGYPASS